MLAPITRFFEQPRQKKAAMAAAIRKFESAGGRNALRDMTSVLHTDELGFVVRVCYMTHVIPPGRVWFRISPDVTEIHELSFDDARQFGEKPWR